MGKAFVSPHLWLLEHTAVEKEARAGGQGRNSSSRGPFLETSGAQEGARIAAPILTFELRIRTFSRLPGIFTLKVKTFL